MTRPGTALACLLLLATAAPAAAQDSGQSKPPRRVRVLLGPQLSPEYPGADDVELGPFVDVNVTRGDEPFPFEAPDESFNISLVDSNGLGIGPALSFQGSRRPKDVGAPVDRVDSTFELGGFIQYELSPSFRIRTEARRGLGGHDGWIGEVSADFVTRNRDAWLFSVGPRLTLADGRYQRAYFGVTPAEAVRTGLATYRPGSGIQAIGATAGFLAELTPRWGVAGFARYDRLVDDAAVSPVVRSFGSRNQYTGGVALTYVFGAGVSR